MAETPNLDALGWNERWAALAADLAPAGGARPGRVVRVDRGLVTVAVESAGDAPVRAEPPDEPIATGDWVLVEDDGEVARVTTILPRTSSFVRGATFEGTVVAEQILAANIDTVFVVHTLESAAGKLRRIERELVLVYESGAWPVVVLTKADLGGEADEARREIGAIAPAVDVVVSSARDGTGIDDLRAYAEGNRTVALIGPSGAGKSTLVNALVGSDVQETGAVRASDQRGRHTTTVRELVLLPGGGVLIDTPGLRSVAMWDADEGLSRAFADIEELATSCRFNDCAHRTEPGCAVRAAVEAGELDVARLDSYLRLDQELDVVARRRNERLISKAVKQFYKQR